MFIQFVDALQLWVLEERLYSGRLQHIDQHNMLSCDELYALRKLLRKHDIIQRSEKHDQRPTPQTQTNERHQLFEVRRNAAGLHGVKCVAAGVEVRFAVARRNECLDPIAEGDQAKEIALL